MRSCTTHSRADVYVGTSAGSPVYHEIKKASRSVRVVSPYLGDHLVEVLLRCQRRGVSVRAVVSDDGWNASDLARGLVVQTREIDADRKRLSRYGSVFGGSVLVAAVALLGWAIIERSLPVAVAAVLLGVLGVLLLCYFQQLAIYIYRYQQRLDGLRVVPSPRSYPPVARPTNLPFVHAKLYVIDDRVAYVGSANLTNAGLFDNLEAMVRLKSPDAVADLAHYIDDLLGDGQLPAYPPEVWARGFFREHRAVSASRGREAVAVPPSPAGSQGAR